MSLPKRPQQHQLETASRLAFERALPASWVYRAESIDYGIDGTVEIVSSGGDVTGRRFAVQLKATAAKTWRSFEIENSTATYFRSLAVPVLLVRYRSATDLLLVQWAHDIPRSREGRSIRVSERGMSEWNADTPERIEAELRQWERIRDPSLALPISLTLDLPPAQFSGHDIHMLARALEDVASRAPGILTLSEIPDPESLGFVQLASKAVYVVLPAGCRFRLEAATPDTLTALTTEALASDVIVAVAGALLEARQRESALALIRGAVFTSSVINHPDGVGLVASALASARDVTTLLRITKELLKRGQLDAAQVCWVFAALAVDPKSPTQHDRFLRAAVEVLEVVKDLNNQSLAAAIHYNTGRYFIRRGPRAREGLRHFLAARKLNRAYLQRDYFWQDVGAILFESGKYVAAVNAYRRAIELGAGAHVRATLADSLTYAGRYEEAALEFQNYVRSSTSPEPHWLLKEATLKEFAAAAGTANQRRESERASALVKAAEIGRSGAQGDELWRHALRFDALFTLAWFNLGVSALRSEDYTAAFERFLITGLLVPWDVEAWTLCIIAGLNAKTETEVFGLAVIVAYRECGRELYRAIGAKLGEANPPGSVAQMMEQLRSLFANVPPVKRPMILRVSRPDGSLHVFSTDSELVSATPGTGSQVKIE